MRLSLAIRVIVGAMFAAVVALHAGESHPRVTVVHGRCTNCPAAFDLRQIQFVTGTIGWASASRLPPGNGTGLATVLHTTDGGRHWKRLPFIWQSGAEDPPPFFFVDRNHGWIASFDMETATGRLSRTRDGGRTWTHRDCDPPLRQLQFVDLRQGYAVSGSSFRTTTDGGETWTKADLPFETTEILSFHDRNRGVIVGWSPPGPLRVIVTRDGGKHWMDAHLPAGIGGNAQAFAWLDAERALLAVESHLLETRDGGATWHLHKTFKGAISAIAVSSEKRGAVFSDDSIASTSDGGATWQTAPLPSAVSECDARGASIRCSSGTDLLKIELGRQ
jgi:photosystem II stability/assembly factor-like uncharacterized protein